MSTRVKRMRFDFLAKDYTTTAPEVYILTEGFDPATVKAQPEYEDSFVQRWHLSLQGEDNPLCSGMMLTQKNTKEQNIYRYDWAFGISLIEPFWWDWMEELTNEGALAIQILLESVENAPEAIPVTATLSALSPSRNTKSKWDLSKITKIAAETAKIGSNAMPIMEYVSGALSLTSNLLESDTDGQKNWFLYQFFDEKLKCPAVEWRINKEVLREYGTLLRGSLFLTFQGSAESNPGRVRLLLRPQIRYCQEGDTNFVVPTEKIDDKKQVYIEITPN